MRALFWLVAEANGGVVRMPSNAVFTTRPHRLPSQDPGLPDRKERQ
jgi:hypothetical protein